MEAYKQEFIEFMVESDVLKFGEFTLKSGRKSPFFMNAGAYVTGSQLKKLGEYYAKAIHDKYGDDFDVLFGPAYKGIPISVVTALFTYSIYSILSQFFSYFNQTNKRTRRLSLYLQQNGCHTMHRIYVMYDSHFYLNNMKFCLYLSTIQRLFIFIYRKCMDIQI